MVGSGPAGLACAQQLARAGHDVVVFEKNDRIGGLLRYGIPDFKMEKWLIDRRMEQMRGRGRRVPHRRHVVGKQRPVEGVANWRSETHRRREKLLAEFDAVVLSGGAEQPRDLPIPGRELDGVHFAMEFLPLQNRRVAGDNGVPELWATGKHVVVIGGGDTGSDCVGTSNRHGAASVTQFELLPQPPDVENNPVWPYWPTRAAHLVLARGRRASATGRSPPRRSSARSGKVEGAAGGARWNGRTARCSEVPGSSSRCRPIWCCWRWASSRPVQSVLEEFGVEKDARGNAQGDDRRRGLLRDLVPKVFAAGDMRRGQSLVVWAIREGRQCARAVDEFLMGSSELPRWSRRAQRAMASQCSPS